MFAVLFFIFTLLNAICYIWTGSEWSFYSMVLCILFFTIEVSKNK
jgi:nicotinamide riboside transporter PnuC